MEDIPAFACLRSTCSSFNSITDLTLAILIGGSAVSMPMQLISSKPSLHANVDCNAIAAAIVSWQISVVRLLLQVNYLFILIELLMLEV